VNAKVFISPDGQLMDPDESPYIWLDKDFMYDSDKIKSVDITPEIKLPLSTTPLCKLVESLRIICKHNFIPALVVMASVVMSFHYSEVKNVWGGCPITVAIGESETGKSTAIRAAL